MTIQVKQTVVLLGEAAASLSASKGLTCTGIDLRNSG